MQTKSHLTVASSSYEAPMCVQFEIVTNSVLCLSGASGQTDDYDVDDYDW